MLSIAIKEQNSHFEHGLKIIMTRLAIGSAQAVTRYLCIPNISYG